MRPAVITTTINAVASFLDIYSEYISDADFVVVLDRKTAPVLNKQTLPPSIHILDFPTQLRYFKDPLLVPLDSIQRRNFGYLYAIRELSPSAVVSVDDDNFPEGDWLNEHIKQLDVLPDKAPSVGDPVQAAGLRYNCELHANCINVFHRGVCFKPERQPVVINVVPKEARVMVNAGLWVGDPDVNAYDRILHPGLKSKLLTTGSAFVSGARYHPFNSQNTAVHSTLFPLLFLYPMYFEACGTKIGRYDDIWQSLVCQRVMRDYNYWVRFGSPVVKQARNAHSNRRDLQDEFPGLMLTRRLCTELDNISLYADSVLDNTYEIADGLLKSSTKEFQVLGAGLYKWLSLLNCTLK